MDHKRMTKHLQKAGPYAAFCAALIFTLLRGMLWNYCAAQMTAQAEIAAQAQDASEPAIALPLSKCAASALPERVRLEIKNLYQLPQLPNGCEITAATMVLNDMGYDVSKVTMADSYLPRQTPYYATDPELAYMGDPHTGWGWYCFAGPVVQAVNAYFNDIGETRHRAVDLTGSTLEELKKQLAAQRPVVFWATVEFQSISYDDSFCLPNGDLPYAGLHVMVLTGYADGILYLNDPLGRITQIEETRFRQIYNAMGSRAMVII